jgi:hypothetical protein
MGIFGKSKSTKALEARTKIIEARLGFLDGRIEQGERIGARTIGREMLPKGEANIALVLTDRRMMWTYLEGPGDLALDIWFKDVVAWVGSETEGGIILEYDEKPDSGEETGIGRFRLSKIGNPAEIVSVVEQLIPEDARTLIPDFEGTGHHDRYPEF